MNFIGLVLHPNTERASIISPIQLNKENSNFSRSKEPKGREAALIKALLSVSGIQKVEISRCEINLELAPLFEPSEWFPRALAAIKKVLRADNPEIRLDDRRWEVEPRYRNPDDWEPVEEGKRIENADIGVEYKKK